MNHRIRIRRCCRALGTGLLLAASLIATAAHALSVVPRSFDELVALADLVVVGTVAAQQSRDDDAGRGISTYITLADLEVVKGTLSEPRYTLRVAGGRVGGRAQVYTGLPQLRTGERYVLFVRGNLRELFPVVGVQQGVFRVLRDGAGRERVLPFASEEHGAAASIADPHSESLDGFLQRVREQLRVTPR